MTALALAGNLFFVVLGVVLIPYGIALALNVRGLAERTVKWEADAAQRPDPLPIGSRYGRFVPAATVAAARRQGVVAILLGLAFVGVDLYVW